MSSDQYNKAMMYTYNFGVYIFLTLHNAEVPYSNEHVNVIAIIFKKKRKLPTKKAATLFIKQW